MTERAIEVEVASGLRLLGRWWDPAPGAPVRGRVVVVHGLGEHGGRYGTLVDALRGCGWGVVAVDQRGHGRSPGPRGVLANFQQLVDDLHAVRARVQAEDPRSGLPALYGHSLGGLVALRSVQAGPGGWARAVLSAPWLATAAAVPRWKRVAAPLLARWLPDLTVPIGLRAEQLTRVPDRQAAWEGDDLVHDRISAGMAATVERAQEAALAAGWPQALPGLFVLPTADPVADTATTRAWVQRQGAADLAVELVEGGVHEPHNDLPRTAVCRTVAAWLGGRAGG